MRFGRRYRDWVGNDSITLYHGTCEKHLDRIIKHGLKPRGKRPTMWKGQYPSAKDRVYLTNCYAFYFATQAALETKSKPVILEVAIDPAHQHLLMPDEDAMGQTDWVDLPSHHGKTLEWKTRWWRNNAMKFRHFWGDSLDRLGTVAFGDTIPYSENKRKKFIWGIQKHIIMPEYCTWFDPSISLLNHRIMGLQYEFFLRILVDTNGEREDIHPHCKEVYDRMVEEGLMTEKDAEQSILFHTNPRAFDALIRKKAKEAGLEVEA